MSGISKENSDFAEGLAAASRGSADDLRAAGWTVAVHNDYRQNGKAWTFWLLTKDEQCVKGEGRTDSEALEMIRSTLRARAALESSDLARGDVVQLAPDIPSVALRGCCAIVTEVCSWGVKARVVLAADTHAPVRLEHGEFKRIGKAEWTQFLV